jgi:hypothetical protein
MFHICCIKYKPYYVLMLTGLRLIFNPKFKKSGFELGVSNKTNHVKEQSQCGVNNRGRSQQPHDLRCRSAVAPFLTLGGSNPAGDMDVSLL